MHGFISGLFILYHFSIFLPLCCCDTVLTTVALYYRLKLESLIHLLHFSSPRLLWLFGGIFVFP